MEEYPEKKGSEWKMRRKEFAKRAAAIFMAILMAVSVSGCGNKSEAVKVEQQEALAENTEDEEELKEIFEDSFGLDEKLERNAGKEEKVYVIADAYGSPNEVIVSEWLKNPEHLDTLEDESSLDGIENVKGDETFTVDGNKVTWKAGGNDIYYQGTSDQELPVAVKVTYLLDGKEVKADELAGKSGLVTVRYTYENKTAGKVKTPFLMVTGLILDENAFTDISVTNGKLISDGSRYILVGFGLPGLSESLELEDGLIPEYFEFSARTTDFQLPMALTFAECDFMMNEKKLSLDEIKEKVNDLSGQYQDGMKKLESGIKQYTDGVSQVAAGVDKLDQGAKQLNDGANQLNVGIRAAENGAGDLENGLEAAKNGSDELAAGANELNQAVQNVNLPDMASQDRSLSPEQQSAAAEQLQKEAENTLGSSTGDYVMAGMDQSDLAELSALSGMSPEEQKKAISTKGAEAAASDTNYAEVRAAVVEAMVDSAKQQMTEAAVAAAKNQLIAANKQDILKAAAVVYAVSGQEGLSAFMQAVSAGGGSLDQYLAAYYTDSAAYADALNTVSAAVGADVEQAVAAGVAAREADIRSACAATVEAKDAEIRQGVEASVDQMLTPAFISGYGSASQAIGADVKAFTDKLQRDLPGLIKDVASSYGTAGMKIGADFVMQAVQVQLDSFQSQLIALKNGTSRLAAGTGELSRGLGTLYNGAGQLRSGMEQLNAGSEALYKGSGDLADGTGALKKGTDQLTASGPELADGGKKLSDATDQIMKKLSESEDKADAFADKINQLREAANAYQSFGGKAENVDGSVRFFIKTEEIVSE